MKICYISNLYNPYIVGGAEISLERLVNATVENNDVFVITTQPLKGLRYFFARSRKKKRIKIYRFFPLNFYHVYSGVTRKIFIFWKALWHIIDLFNIHSFLTVFFLLNKERPDIVHTSNLDGISFSVLWSAKLLKIPVIHTLHDYHLICPYANLVCQFTKFNVCKRQPLLCRLRMFLKRFVVSGMIDEITGSSRAVIEMHHKYGFFGNIPSRVIPNFVSCRAQKFNPKRRDDILDILYVGRLTKPKGVDVLIKALKGIQSNKWRLHVLGDGPEKESLRKLAGRDDRIMFHGVIKHPAIDDFYKKVDVLVIPSVWPEVFGVVIVEAFMHGCSVIGSKTGGIQDIIQDGRNGYLFSPGDVGSLRQKIEWLIDDKSTGGSTLSELQRNAYEDAVQYGRENIVNRFTDVYNEIYGNNGKRVDGSKN